MQIIPVINCPDFECVKKRLAQVSEIGCDWVHFDVSDGKFTPDETWNDPRKLSLKANLEVHLMAEKPEEIVNEWLRAGAKRIIIHLESFRGCEEKLNSIFEKCAEQSAEAMLAIKPETGVDELVPFLDELLFVQVLAVPPGPSGQKFNDSAVEKIKFLRERAPEISIEVDGGINLETMELVKEAGADIAAAGSFIFENSNPGRAYRQLKAAADEFFKP